MSVTCRTCAAGGVLDEHKNAKVLVCPNGHGILLRHILV